MERNHSIAFQPKREFRIFVHVLRSLMVDSGDKRPFKGIEGRFWTRMALLANCKAMGLLRDTKRLVSQITVPVISVPILSGTVNWIFRISRQKIVFMVLLMAFPQVVSLV
ncbi:hypothetical protein JTE90_013831 [Oedothorax gibbosus]|uniref:Uncharacterized protein n=1 Tax=Oedothorax gibbosus TaxID=931172 RepID=A0AAV6VJN7_9ARAC|nr:hypothetical protein JTE90_013831 [Oedothorax gibbosus]